MEQLPTQLFCSPHRPTRDGFRPVVGSRFNGKPDGGFWTSTWETAWDEGWPGWCAREQYGYTERGWLLDPLPCRVYTVTDEMTATVLCERYCIPTFPDSPYPSWHLDWEQIAQEWDAIRLTAPYNPALRFASPDSKISMNFYGWDCESTVWLRWMFEAEPIFADMGEKAKEMHLINTWEE